MAVVSLWLWLLALPVQTPYVRTHDQEVRRPLRPVLASQDGERESVFPAPCLVQSAGRHGETVPDEGTLDVTPFYELPRLKEQEAAQRNARAALPRGRNFK